MKDRSFVELIELENLEQLNIDPRLIDSFKRVMPTMQTYFNAKGYTLDRDYKAFFKTYVLTPDALQLRFQVNDEPSKRGFQGFYTLDGNRICIDKKYIHSSDLDAILCNAFIAFLVLKEADSNPTEEVERENFIDIALTEMLTRKMYPKSKAYEPQVKMMRFANALCGTITNYGVFLQGKVDFEVYKEAWNGFIEKASIFEKHWEMHPLNFEETVQDENYIALQRYLIDSYVDLDSISSFAVYQNIMNILHDRPAPDREFTNPLVMKIDEKFIHQLGIHEEPLYSFYLQCIKEHRTNNLKLEKYNGQDVYEFSVGDRHFTLCQDLSCYAHDYQDFEYSIVQSEDSLLFSLVAGDKHIKFDIHSIDFAKSKKEIRLQQKKLEGLFSKDALANVQVIARLNYNANFIRLEKFTLPVIGANRYQDKPIVIYAATYENRMELLDTYQELGTIYDIEILQYLGLTGNVMGEETVCCKSLGSLDKGLVCSALTEKDIENEAHALLYEKIVPYFSKIEVYQIIEEYKKSEAYKATQNLEEDAVKELAINDYIEKKYKKLKKDEKEELINEVIQTGDKFIIASKDGYLDMFILYGESAYEAQIEVLIDENEFGLYNEYFNRIKHYPAYKNVKTEKYQSFALSESGKVLFSNPTKINPKDYTYNKKRRDVAYSKNKEGQEEIKEKKVDKLPIDMDMAENDTYVEKEEENNNKKKKNNSAKKKKAPEMEVETEKLEEISKEKLTKTLEKIENLEKNLTSEENQYEEENGETDLLPFHKEDKNKLYDDMMKDVDEEENNNEDAIASLKELEEMIEQTEQTEPKEISEPKEENKIKEEKEEKDKEEALELIPQESQETIEQEKQEESPKEVLEEKKEKRPKTLSKKKKKKKKNTLSLKKATLQELENNENNEDIEENDSIENNIDVLVEHCRTRYGYYEMNNEEKRNFNQVMRRALSVARRKVQRSEKWNSNFSATRKRR